MLPSIFGENLFDDFFTNPFGLMDTSEVSRHLYGKNAKNMMKTDVKEKAQSYELAIDLPGFKKDEINIDLRDGYLTIQASKGLDKDEQDKDGRYIRRERYAGSMSRSFYVGDVKPEDVSAKFEDGILKLTLPKAGQVRLPENNRICIE
ncbi:MAG: Hsp20/alpha crystallin family protein [Firmicutes bacterium]|nr:Hsp20/alpha crystallin family protein [Bacillota bacterium]